MIRAFLPKRGAQPRRERPRVFFGGVGDVIEFQLTLRSEAVPAYPENSPYQHRHLPNSDFAAARAKGHAVRCRSWRLQIVQPTCDFLGPVVEPKSKGCLQPFWAAVPARRCRPHAPRVLQLRRSFCVYRK
eukprot:216831-Rhodomonas_salina.2